MTLAEQMAADAAASPSPTANMTLAQRMAADAAPPPPPAPPKPSYKPAGKLSRDVDSQAALGGMVIHGVTGMGASIIGGYHALGKLATGGSLDEAVDALHEDQQRLTYVPQDEATPEGVGVKAMDSQSLANPLTWPARAGGAVGNGISSVLPNSVGGADMIPLKSALSAGADAGIQVFAPIKGPGMIRAGMGAVRSLGEISRISPAEAAANAASIRARAVAAVGAPEPVQPLTAPEAVPAQPVGNAPAGQASQSAPPPTPREPTIADASPELQKSIVDQAQSLKPGERLDPVVVQRHVEADTLPVPVKLTPGQASLDPVAVSNEMNSRGKSAPLVSPDFYNQQGKALSANLDVIRKQAAPDVVADNPTDHGQVLIDQIKEMDEPVVKDIDSKYQALRDANGGEFPVDPKTLLENTKAALKKELLTGDAPPSQMSALEGLAEDGKMSMEQFLNLRRNLGNIARTSPDGNARTAASIMVQQLEDLPLSGGAAELKPLADAARGAARARFKAMDADPAYKAAVGDGVGKGEASPLADSFVQKYIIGAPRANIAKMRENLANQPLAQQTIPAATVDFLRSKAKADGDTGRFASDSFNNVVSKLEPKFDQVLDPASAKTIKQVANVAKYTSTQPKGSFVNNSNTLVGAAGEVGKGIVQDFLAAKTMGASKVLSSLAGKAAEAKAGKAATTPGANIPRLSDLAPKDD